MRWHRSMSKGEIFNYFFFSPSPTIENIIIRKEEKKNLFLYFKKSGILFYQKKNIGSSIKRNIDLF